MIITLSGDKTLLEEEDLTALLELLLKSSSVISTKLGHHEQPKSSKSHAIVLHSLSASYYTTSICNILLSFSYFILYRHLFFSQLYRNQ